MSTIDANELVLMESREIEEAQTRKAKTKPVDNLRPSDELVTFHLLQSSPLGYLGAEPRRTVINGSIDLYRRLKARDPIDSIYAMAIVALHNAVMSSYSEAARCSKTRGEDLDRAYEGTALLIELVTARENWPAVLDDGDRREEVLQELLRRYGLTASASADET